MNQYNDRSKVGPAPNIIYGDGEVFYKGTSKCFEIIYKGSIKITNSPDNLFLGANKYKIVGVMLDKNQDLPEKLFDYIGEFKLVGCKVVKNGKLESEVISSLDADYWKTSYNKWEEDTTKWEDKNTINLVGIHQRYDKKKIVVNNNIQVQFKGQYEYKDGTLVPANELIHIMNDGTAMTGGMHTKDSVYIYPPKYRKGITRQQLSLSQIRQATSSGGGY